jgi:acetylornithine deacetylase/succinyl-diaminopimelate desuccinylase-like protein
MNEGRLYWRSAKTVIASKAFAKISMRLVQEWEEITELFQIILKVLHQTGESKVKKPHHGGQGYVTPIDSIGYQAANKAYTETFGKPCTPYVLAWKYSDCCLV